MGDYSKYIEAGGFTELLYHDVGDIITSDNGVQGKVINGVTDPNDEEFHESLPLFSNKSCIGTYRYLYLLNDFNRGHKNT